MKRNFSAPWHMHAKESKANLTNAKQYILQNSSTKRYMILYTKNKN